MTHNYRFSGEIYYNNGALTKVHFLANNATEFLDKVHATLDDVAIRNVTINSIDEVTPW